MWDSLTVGGVKVVLFIHNLEILLWLTLTLNDDNVPTWSKEAKSNSLRLLYARSRNSRSGKFWNNKNIRQRILEFNFSIVIFKIVNMWEKFHWRFIWFWMLHRIYSQKQIRTFQYTLVYLARHIPRATRMFEYQITWKASSVMSVILLPRKLMYLSRFIFMKARLSILSMALSSRLIVIKADKSTNVWVCTFLTWLNAKLISSSDECMSPYETNDSLNRRDAFQADEQTTYLESALRYIVDLVILQFDTLDPFQEVERRGRQRANLVVAEVEMLQVRQRFERSVRYLGNRRGKTMRHSQRQKRVAHLRAKIGKIGKLHKISNVTRPVRRYLPLRKLRRLSSISNSQRSPGTWSHERAWKRDFWWYSGYCELF